MLCALVLANSAFIIFRFLSFLGQFAQVLTFDMLGPDSLTSDICYILSTAHEQLIPLLLLHVSSSVKLLKC